MVISWDKNENNPNPIPPATEISQPPGRQRRWLTARSGGG